MDYEGERDYCLKLIYALEFILDILEENPAEYPLLDGDIRCLINGRCVIDAEGGKHFINGLRLQVDELYMTFEALDLEVSYEGSCNGTPTGEV